ncbi:MAG TPA: glycosyltransferase [Gemmatimonadales bacterium]|nr:glycosyltransferase [Gemmatimonadales bacterium]
MPTAVLDIDLAQPPAQFAVDARYTRALLLIRWQGVPIGSARFPVYQGHVALVDPHRTLASACGWPYWERRFAETMHLTPDGLPARPTPPCTIAICTRERPDDLRDCLEAIAKLPDDGQEVLVIDNAPRSEATRRVVEQFPGVRYVREDRVGLDVARNRALREATRDIVAFTDDDARPDRGWLRALARNFADPVVLCVTGLTAPLELETRAQERFEEESPFGRGFIRKVFDPSRHNPHRSGPLGAGVNMAVRRSVLESIGGFDEALDAGTPTASGGDHDLFTRVLLAGHRVVYDPAALVWHRHRRDWASLRRTLQGYGTGVYAAWTKSFLVRGELAAPAMALGWFWHDQLPGLLRSVRRHHDRRSVRLVLAELWGCALGPWAYLRSVLKVGRARR